MKYFESLKTQLMAFLRVLTIFILAIAAHSKLPSYNINPQQITISGLSSGGFMAVQMHFAFSSIFKGAAIFAGGPFYCAQSSMISATTACMSSPSLIPLQSLISKVQQLSDAGSIDSIDHLKNQNVFLFSGTADTVVYQGVMQDLAAMYENFGAKTTKKFDLPAQHSFPTDNYGNQCNYQGEPYINNCGYNGAHEFYKVLYGSSLVAPIPEIDENLQNFDQSDYSSYTSSFHSKGYLYVPKKCQAGNSCGLHVALHGCLQTLDDISDGYVRHVGINEVAEANDIIVLYPQIKKSILYPMNPNGCWDWWGYSDGFLSSGNYVTKKGVQMSALIQMIKDLGVKSDQELFNY